jgi:hypothetical protein
MKILLVTNLYPPNSIGGYERLCATLAGALAAKGHTVEVLTSSHGGGRPKPEPIPVDRSLQLLVSSRSIYEPFEGGSAEREAITVANLAAARKVVERFRPETLFAGNLMFLDRSFLEGLSALGPRLAYLLTDVWLIQMLDDRWLQRYFKQEIHAAGAVDRTAVAELPGDVLTGARAPVEDSERARRAQIEARLAAGRSAFQLAGVCHLCGPTVFLVKRPTPGTVALPPETRTSVSCGRCGLEASVRAVVHAADALARSGARVGIVAPDPAIARVLRTQGRDRVAADAGELGTVDIVAVLGGGGPDPAGEGRPRQGQRMVYVEPGEPAPAGNGGRTSFEVWSDRYGYLGHDYRVGLWSGA